MHDKGNSHAFQSRPVIVVESGRFNVANCLSSGEALVRDLLKFKREITERGNATFCGDREHDDLVVTVALAVWWGAHLLARSRELVNLYNGEYENEKDCSF